MHKKNADRKTIKNLKFFHHRQEEAAKVNKTNKAIKHT
jgi:hypothetical protein